VGDSEDGAFWTAFLRSLKTRGLHGVQLVISDAHAGLKAAIQAVLLGTAWQRSFANMDGGGIVSLVHLHRRERTLAA
jgi:transposase-like protein